MYRESYYYYDWPNGCISDCFGKRPIIIRPSVNVTVLIESKELYEITLMVHDLVAMFVPIPWFPSWNDNWLHNADESTYTAKHLFCLICIVDHQMFFTVLSSVCSTNGGWRLISWAGDWEGVSQALGWGCHRLASTWEGSRNSWQKVAWQRLSSEMHEQSSS